MKEVKPCSHLSKALNFLLKEEEMPLYNSLQEVLNKVWEIFVVGNGAVN